MKTPTQRSYVDMLSMVMKICFHEHTHKIITYADRYVTIWLFNIAMENPL